MQLLAGVLVVVMTVASLVTQRRSLRQSPAADRADGSQAQRTLLYLVPAVVAASGVAFPVGVLCYWATSNLWTLGQQLWVTRRATSPRPRR